MQVEVAGRKAESDETEAKSNLQIHSFQLRFSHFVS
jgi:hypothetical protein